MGLMEHNQGISHNGVMMVKINAFVHNLVHTTPMLYLVLLEKDEHYRGVVALMVSKNRKNELIYQTPTMALTNGGYKEYVFEEGVVPKYISSVPFKLNF